MIKHTPNKLKVSWQQFGMPCFVLQAFLVNKIKLISTSWSHLFFEVLGLCSEVNTVILFQEGSGQEKSTIPGYREISAAMKTQMKTKKTKGLCDLYTVAAEEVGVDAGLTEGFSWWKTCHCLTPDELQ